MALALFDLDHTLVSTDTPSLWFDFLIEKKILDPEIIKPRVQAFYNDYANGQLDYQAYLDFELSTLINHSLPLLLQWRDEFREAKLRPQISQAARDLLQQHQATGDITVIITATNYFIAEASALELNVETLLATNLESNDQGFTGKTRGTLCFQEGKIKKINEWCEETGHSLKGSWFYSDSQNDLPLLEVVDHPVAVNADPTLSEIAKQRGWPELDLCIQP